MKSYIHLYSSDQKIDFKVGNAMPLLHMPLGTKVHCVEMLPGAGAKIARTAGSAIRLISIDGDDASLRLPSGEIRLVKSKCLATIGAVGNGSHQKSTIGKAGRSRWLGKRPRDQRWLVVVQSSKEACFNTTNGRRIK